MLTATMIAMFYLGTASGVMGAVLMGTFRSIDSDRVKSLSEVVGSEELTRAA